MSFARSVWKILVAIKDGLVLLLLLLFFWALYAVLTLRPAPGMVHDGALYIELNGPVVEEKARLQPSAILLSGEAPRREFQERDLTRAIEAAATDTRIKAVVLDLEDFGGGRQVSLSRVGAAMDKVRAAKKPVLVRGMLYTDDAVQLAAHASEAWVDPIGGAAVTGPGGTGLYYKALLDKLQVKAHVFKVGTFKSAVEPFLRQDSSPEAKEATGAVYAALWQDWQDEVKKARPKADIALVTQDPAKWLAASNGDAAQAAVKAGLVDRVGDKAAFGKRVAEIVGADPAGTEGAFRATKLGPYLADRAPSSAGKAIAVVTVAGDIVDGNGGPGVAGGDRIADLVDKAAASGDYAALVVRVDSPGGSVTAAERIRSAIARAKAKGLPVVVSMGNLAASGGYWVSTPAERIFAEPGTITGSIGIFAVIPSFEGALAKIGVGTDGVRTTPLSGQPDVFGGLSPQVEAVIQTEIEANYRRFLDLVAKSRHKTPAEINLIAQGRIWDGGTARQIGLVDQFGGLDDAVAWAAKKAGAATWHPVYLGAASDPWNTLLEEMAGTDSTEAQPAAHDLAGRVALAQSALAGRIAADLDRLTSGQGAQAWCMECAGLDEAAAPSASAKGWLAALLKLLV
ncbi:signal peptide peptidase SppA [Novosphingobium cyanobacteriorum]|uniref:Signal peptide peptidase SppA n=1 Tax=Novosphingobium cyanobacteriorum TaxID=3024215 RepID=A0ABT6CJY3_9SPHN|nr:signal peptide peptidase SppA [Novosphingobium cyanobacteriorum]MDF8334239.1 signal peptide peptidase SppA [Novosphingobium cyanobacteriorum]